MKAAVTGFAPAVSVTKPKTITDTERALYESVWSSCDSYGAVSPGQEHLPHFLSMSGATSGTVLDAGCGSGKGGLALAAKGFTVTLADLTPVGLTDEAVSLPFVSAGLWSDLRAVFGRSFDYVYCCDVLEHIPQEFTMLTIARLLEVSSQGLFLSIALVPDEFGLLAGKPLHQTVQPYPWWRDRLRDLGELVESKDLISFGLFFLRPR